MRTLLLIMILLLGASESFGQQRRQNFGSSQQMLQGMMTEDARFLRDTQSGSFIGAGNPDYFIGRSGNTIESIARIESIRTLPNYTIQPQIQNPQPLFPYRIQIPDYDLQINISPLQDVINYRFDSVELEVDENVLILRGKVNSEREKRIVELLANFHPGVSSVENLIGIDN